MNAQFGWPTKSPLPKFRVNRIVVVGLGFLAVACSENLTQPHERTPVIKAPAWQPSPDVVIMERTTTSASVNGDPPTVVTSRQVLTPQTRVAGRTLTVRAFAAPTTAKSAGLPLPTLSLPARREVAICNALPSWTERTRGADGRGIVLTGVGDAPASTIKVTQADGSVVSIERSWTRTTSTWQLDRQVTSGAKGFRDVVSYQHQNAAGKALNNAIPSSTCTGQQALVGQASVTASRSFYAPYSATLYAKLVPGAGVFADEGCWGYNGDPCFDKRMSIYRDEIGVASALVAVTVACVTPVVVTVGPCALALTAYAAAVGYLGIDLASYQNCLDNQRSRLPEELVGASAARSALDSTGGHSLASLSPHIVAVSNCGSSGSTAAPPSCRWDTYEISYDGGETWYFWASFLICDDAM
ncbi:MAG: hypothetical protein M3Z05_17860 [Gemmatimonadota bacterium]|nr:hypothetical protein [Gemmatimonadota bacterium]